MLYTKHQQADMCCALQLHQGALQTFTGATNVHKSYKCPQERPNCYNHCNQVWTITAASAHNAAVPLLASVLLSNSKAQIHQEHINLLRNSQMQAATECDIKYSSSRPETLNCSGGGIHNDCQGYQLCSVILTHW